jgi:hypothetical protein
MPSPDAAGVVLQPRRVVLSARHRSPTVPRRDHARAAVLAQGASGTASLLSGASVIGELKQNASSAFDSWHWSQRLANSTTDVTLTETRALSAGAYRRVIVTSGTTLLLSPGRYDFDSLILQPDATIQVGSEATRVYRQPSAERLQPRALVRRQPDPAGRHLAPVRYPIPIGRYAVAVSPRRGFVHQSKPRVFSRRARRDWRVRARPRGGVVWGGQAQPVRDRGGQGSGLPMVRQHLA